MRCKHSHERRKKGGKHYECPDCDTQFPCSHPCDHWDCIVATGRLLPSHAGETTREALSAELNLLYPDNKFAIHRGDL